MTAKSVWNGAKSEFPGTESGREKLSHFLKSLAVSVAMDGNQPWEFRLEKSWLELYANNWTAPQTGNSDDRELMIRCGRALFHAKLELKRLGCLGPVELFPNLDNTRLVARIHYVFSPGPGAIEAAASDDFARMPAPPGFQPGSSIPETFLHTLSNTVARERAWLEFARCESSRKLLLELAQGDVAMAITHSVGMPPETYGGFQPNGSDPARPSVGRSGGDRHERYTWWKKPFLKFTARTTTSNGAKLLSQAAALAVLKTKTDDQQGWLAAGQARARVQLQAQLSGVLSYCLNEPLRHRHLREELRTCIGRKGFVQAIIGFQALPVQSLVTQPSQNTAAQPQVFP